MLIETPATCFLTEAERIILEFFRNCFAYTSLDAKMSDSDSVDSVFQSDGFSISWRFITVSCVELRDEMAESVKDSQLETPFESSETFPESDDPDKRFLTFLQSGQL